MWWVLTQIIAIFFIFLAQVSNRYFGFSILGFLSYSSIMIGICAWLLPLSYSLAPTFFSVYFLGIICLSIFGVIGSNLIFHETISLTNYIGIFGSILCCILINWK